MPYTNYKPASSRFVVFILLDSKS